jgi:hypothetical protein
MAWGQGTFLTNGFEYPIAASKPGDQVHPDIALGPNGGYLVWEDNVTSSSGLAISAQRLDSGFSRVLSSFQVNSSTVGDHERARVSLLNGGGAAFVWQGGRYGFQHIYARFLSASNVWATGDVMVNGSTNFVQIDPVAATLNNGNVVVVWSSFNQVNPTSLRDIYAQIFSPDGQKIGSEFLVNQFTSFNQRTPAVAALNTGGFVVAWISEQQRVVGTVSGQLLPTAQLQAPSVDVFARLFSAAGQAVNTEFLVNTASSACADPTVAASSTGGFIVGWGEKSSVVPTDSWDVFARAYNAQLTAGSVRRINTETYGDQLGPRLGAAGSEYLMVWTSLGQDNSMEGVFGQFLAGDGSANGQEVRVNTTWVSKQMHPAVASDGVGSFAVSWTSFTGARTTFDLFAQRYVNIAQPLPAMAAPFVYVPFVTSGGIFQPRVLVSWPAQTGLAVDHYDLFVDGSLTTSLTTNAWTMTAANGLSASSTHTFQVQAVGADSRKTPLSPAASATTWSGYSWGGIPFEWMAGYYGMDSSQWPSANVPIGPGSPSLYQVFLSGGKPTDPSTWLRTSIEASTIQGETAYLLHWNTQPGMTYQVQTSTDMKTWVDFQSPRFAADVTDSVPVPNNNLQYYRLVRLH